jgi:hypothetical protein
MFAFLMAAIHRKRGRAYVLLLIVVGRLLGIRARMLREAPRWSVVPLLGSWRVRLLSGWVDRLLGRVTDVLGVRSGARADVADTGVTAAAQYSEDDDGANYGPKADNANHKDDEAH